MMKTYYILLVTIALIFLSCSKNTTGNADKNYTPINSVSQIIHASTGGTINNKNGVSLTIPPGALNSDTLITVSELVISDSAKNTLVGVKFEPDGLELKKPALIEVPFSPPSNWDENDLILDYDFYGKDATAAAWNGYCAKVSLENGKWVAKTIATHFSGKLFIRNCHSGTMDYVIGQLKNTGRSPDSLITMVRKKYPGENIEGYQTEKVDERTIQRFLGTFFTEKYSYNRGEKVPANVLTELSEYTRSGRNVALAFTFGKWGVKNSEGLYPNFIHTASLQEKNGAIQIRNSANVEPVPKLIELLGGTNTVYYPFDKIDEFRELQSGVSVELAAGAGPDGFSKDNKKFGIWLYGPLNGKNWAQVSLGMLWEDPWVFAVLAGSREWEKLSGELPRPRPYTAVKIFVQNPEEKSVALDGFDKCSISLENINCLFSNGNEWKVGSYNWEGKGKFNGYTFTASSDTTIVSKNDPSSSWKDSTTIKVELDESMSSIKNFSAVYKQIFSGGSTYTTYTYKTTGTNLPDNNKNPYSTMLFFNDSGVKVKNYLTLFSLSAKVNDFDPNVVKQYECLDNTSLSITFWKTNELAKR
jgi:hypothetical protein